MKEMSEGAPLRWVKEHCTGDGCEKEGDHQYGVQRREKNKDYFWQLNGRFMKIFVFSSDLISFIFHTFSLLYTVCAYHSHLAFLII